MYIDKKDLKNVSYIDKRFLSKMILFLSGKGITIDEIKHGFTREETEFMKTVLEGRAIGKNDE